MRAPWILAAALAALAAPGLAWAVCGDGVLDAGETCDDVNVTPDDGCDELCQVEEGWECAPAGFTLDFAEVLDDDYFHDDPSWTISDDQLTVTQALNANPAVYVSTLPVSGVSMTFTLTVDSSSDDDFIGWAIGYEAGEHAAEDADWLLFDWKQGTQNWDGYDAPAGLAFNRVVGPIDISYDFWGHVNNVVEQSRALTLGSVGWVDFQTYVIQVDYSINGFDIWVDGTLEFSERGLFPTGYFSFYNFSQESIVYTLTSPTEGSVCGELDSDGDGLTDPTEFALGLDAYSPDSDGDGIDDLTEVDDVEDPADSDGDGVIDAREPAGQDTDGDGIEDTDDPDDDGDGIPTEDELGPDPANPQNTDGDLFPDYLDPDDDGDGIDTADEIAAGTDPLDAGDPGSGDDDDAADDDDDDDDGTDDDDGAGDDDDDDGPGDDDDDDELGTSASGEWGVRQADCGCASAGPGARAPTLLLLLLIFLSVPRRRRRP